MTSDENITQNEVLTSVETQEGGSLSGRTGTRGTKVQKPRQRQASNQTPSTIKIGRHGAEMIMTSDPEKSKRMLSQVGLPEGMTATTIEERLTIVKSLIARSMGVQDIESVPNRIGFDLTNQAEREVLFGVLKLMTNSDYKGTFQSPTSEVLKDNRTPKNEKTIESDTQGYQLIATQTHIGGAYENIPSTPILRITQGDLIQVLGYDPSSQSDRERVAQAVVSLATKQNFLMWTRFSRDKNGKVERRNGRTKFEVVSTFSPVLNVKFVADEESGKLKHYDIALAPVFLDEISREYGSDGDGYFLLIPSDCNREIEQAYKDLFPYRARVSPKIYSLCYWLRLQVVEMQSRERNPFTKRTPDPVLVVSYDDLCRQLNISEGSFKSQRKRVRNVVHDGLLVAQKIGYINGFRDYDEAGQYQFDINFDYYPNRFKQEETQETPQGISHQEPTPPQEPEQETTLF